MSNRNFDASVIARDLRLQKSYFTGLIGGRTTFDDYDRLFVPPATPAVPSIPQTPGGTNLWLTKIGGIGSETFANVDVDSVGNIYVVGSYSSIRVSTFNADDTTLPISSVSSIGAATNDDVFLAKYNSSGITSWITRIGGNSLHNVNVPFVTIDSNNDIYVTGIFATDVISTYNAGDQDTVIFSTFNSAPSITETFITKYNSNGVNQWLTKIGGPVTDSPTGISSDSSNNIYIIGRFISLTISSYNAGNQSNGISSLTSKGSFDIYIAKYNSNGINQWMTQIGGSSSDGGAIPLKMSISPNNNIYVSGGYNSAVLSTYSAGSNNVVFSVSNTSPVTSVFIAKYNLNGAVQWLTKIGGSNSTNGISITANNNEIFIACVATTSSIVMFNSNNNIFPTNSIFLSEQSSIVIIAKYNTHGINSWVTYVNCVGGNVARPFIEQDTAGNIIISGQYTSNAGTVFLSTYNAGSSVAISSVSNNNTLSNIIIAKYNTNGINQWLTQIAGSGDDSTSEITKIDANNNFYVVGHYSSNPLSTFNANNQTTPASSISNSGSFDIFLAKYKA